MFNKLQQCVPILYATSLILQRIINQIILPLFKISRREWIIHFKPAAISLRDPHLEELKTIAVLSQERESFVRTTLGIKSLKMLLASFPKNSSWPISPAIIGKIALMATGASMRLGSSRGCCSSIPLCHTTGLVSAAMLKLQNNPESFLQSFSHFARVFMWDQTWWNTLQHLKTGLHHLYETQELLSGLKIVLPNESQYNNHSFCTCYFFLHCVN